MLILNRIGPGNRRLGLFVLVLGFGAVTVPAVRADTLEHQLRQEAPKIMQFLQEQGCRNVGVLKFRVKKGKAASSDNVGTLNMTLANRLEIALVLANSPDPAKQVGVIQNASVVAARLKGANHLTQEGRRKLFDSQFPLAWGNQEVTPDAFLTGLALISEDLKTMTVGVMVFSPKDDCAELHRVTQFTAANEAAKLVEAGESFLVRGIFDSGRNDAPKGDPVQRLEQINKDVIKEAAKVKQKEQAYPLEDKACPIELEIRYNNKPVPYQLVNGRALVREPERGEKVTFVLRRKAGSKGRFGVVLKVNGENTLFRQKLGDLQCSKWIVEPGDPPFGVRGFQINDKEIQEFRVLSRAESKQNEMNYGEDVGTISLVVFQERKGQEPPPPLDPGADDEAAMVRGVFPAKKPANLAALKHQLRESGSRGLIVGGAVEKGGIRKVEFKPDPVPVLSATITYYKKQ